jgi:hypothetical protein
MILKIFSPKYGIFYSKYHLFVQIINHNFGFQEKRQFLPTIGKHC